MNGDRDVRLTTAKARTIDAQRAVIEAQRQLIDANEALMALEKEGPDIGPARPKLMTAGERAQAFVAAQTSRIDRHNTVMLIEVVIHLDRADILAKANELQYVVSPNAGRRMVFLGDLAALLDPKP